MSLIVQKFGGSSVADADRIRNVARIITETYRKGHSVVAVLSAQGDTTDDLIEKAKEINPSASKRKRQRSQKRQTTILFHIHFSLFIDSTIKRCTWQFYSL